MISVLMSVYNEQISWIKEAVESILNQTYDDWEFIIIIDNPNINIEIREYLLGIAEKNKKVKLLWNEKNIGLAASLNKGIQVSNGEYIARMDADDISLPNRLKSEYTYICKEKCDLISANKININEDGNILSYDPEIKRNPNKILQYSNIIIHPLVLVKTEAIKSMGGYRPLRNSEDLDLWLRMIEKGYKIGILNEYLLKYRIRANSASVERRLEQYYVDKYIVQLMKERKKMGSDSFSKERQELFLKKRKITDSKKKKFDNANVEIEKALMKKNRNENGWFFHLFLGFILCPNYVIDKMYRYYFSTIKKW